MNVSDAEHIYYHIQEILVDGAVLGQISRDLTEDEEKVFCDVEFLGRLFGLAFEGCLGGYILFLLLTSLCLARPGWSRVAS